jgi:GTP-binding protein
MSKQSEALFTGPVKFAQGVAQMESLPGMGWPELAFAGRSNVGKSSLLNALTNKPGLAHVSKTPGRTQQLNFFNAGDKLWLVDMPGYGYAAVSKKLVAEWNRLIRDYLRGRASLRRVCVLVDSRHGLKENDLEVFRLLDEAAVSYQVILTKADEPPFAELEATRQAVMATLKRHAAAHPEVLTVSSHNGAGLVELREALYKVAMG